MGIKVNLSDKEAKSGDYVPLPSGSYHCAIVEADNRESNSEANPGKPMIYFTFNILDGVYADRTMGTNACLWEGAAYTIVNLLKAIGEFENCGGKKNLDIPTAPEFYVGRELMVRRGVNPKTKKENPNDDPMSWVEVRGFSAVQAGSSSSTPSVGSSGSGSLLP